MKLGPKNDKKDSKEETKKITIEKNWMLNRDLPEAFEPKNVLQAKDGHCYEMRQNMWGRAVVKVKNPFGQELPKGFQDKIKLPVNLPKIPARIWKPWIDLCFELCWPTDDRKSISGRNEVQIVLLLDEATRTEWKAIVPKQEVSGGRVESELAESIDLVTGEEYAEFPPPGWIHAGTSHSHNTMSAFFSGTDDQYELVVPGVHIVVGSLTQGTKDKGPCYTPKASIAFYLERKIVDFSDLVDDDLGKIEETFPEKALDYITCAAPIYSHYSSYGSFGFGAYGNWEDDDHWLRRVGVDRNPFDWSRDFQTSRREGQETLDQIVEIAELEAELNRLPENERVTVERFVDKVFSFSRVGQESDSAEDPEGA